jgi:hypothetical protein
MCLGRRNQSVGWADDRSPTNSLESQNGGSRSSVCPTLWLKSGRYSEHVSKRHRDKSGFSHLPVLSVFILGVLCD